MLETLRQRNFALLWFGGLISFAGDWALIIALPVFIYDLTGSTLATGAMFIAQTLPRLLFGPLAGVFVDRWNRKHTLVVANLAQGAVLPLLLLVQSTDLLWLLYLVAFIQTSISLVMIVMNGVGMLFLVSGLLSLTLLRGHGIAQRNLAPTHIGAATDPA